MTFTSDQGSRALRILARQAELTDCDTLFAELRQAAVDLGFDDDTEAIALAYQALTGERIHV